MSPSRPCPTQFYADSAFLPFSCISGEFVPAKDGKTFSVVNPATGKEIAQVSEASPKDVDVAVAAARKAFNESWGLKVGGGQRARMLNKLADLIEEHADEIAAIESLDNGKAFSVARNVDIAGVIDCIRCAFIRLPYSWTLLTILLCLQILRRLG